MKKLFFLLPAALLLAGCNNFTKLTVEQSKPAAQNNQETPAPPQGNTQIQQPAISPPPEPNYRALYEGYATLYYSYELRDRNNKESAPDQELLRADKKTNQKTVIISSVKQILNKYLVIFAKPDNSTTVIFKSAFPDTDNPGGELYSFNTATLKFSRMKVNAVYDGFFGGTALSPDQAKLVWVSNPEESGKDQTMYLIDLIADTSRVLVKLSGNETFNAGGYAMSSSFDIKWPKNNKVLYAVADQSKKTGQPNEEAKVSVIGYREVAVQ